eukprot:CAMPEP_0170381768 /NCGR_PEP_ID=MMETSP0117_2-20130122/14584_1 /TAXON_ID=400756 /ORGANISM="Durinskia baltica, Strain CSIRO CS-38" /LENGTH=325 /DNA_ID=CAMNT_0010637359 /DNA_START=254 /DNA_END=1231 /DNA_ORIENTATION=+
MPTKEQQYKKDLHNCMKELTALIEKSNCHPILLRLAWSDAVTYDVDIIEWPFCGGVNGSIRFERELAREANAGLTKAVSLISAIKRRYSRLSWADVIQMAAVVGIKLAGGPEIQLTYGRLDAPAELLETEEAVKNATNTKQLRNVSSIAFKHVQCPIYPSAVPPYPDGAPTADVHIRHVFYRLGLNNRETVALCGGHTLGRAFKDRTGVCAFSSGDQGATIFTQPTSNAKGDGAGGVGMAGGCSWTRNWLQFDNSYFRRIQEDTSDSSQLLWLPTDQALYDCPEFRPYFLKYARSQDAFFVDYAAAHVKMSELGAKFKYKISLAL